MDGLTLMEKLRKSDLVNVWLPFVQSDKYQDRLLKLTSIIPELKKLPQSYTISAIVSWIHYSNKIEFEAMDTEGDTENVLKEYSENDFSGQDDESKKMAVRNTFNLLKTSYNKEVLDSKCPQKFITFDTEKLKLFHSIMFASVASFSDCFRKSGASTKLPDESNFPHHELIPSALQTLGLVSYKLLDAFLEEEIGSNGTQTIGFCFALAAFVQFHFVSIHPFEDGNGRICRYLSKRILDWVCPFPFPMFHNRDDYLDALIKGRTAKDVAFSPEPLMELLIDSALNYYGNLIASAHDI